MQFRELMTENFSLIGESSSIAEARSKLSSDDYLVVTSDEGLPLTVITMADLPGTGQRDLTEYIPKLPPTVIIGCDMDVSSIYEAPTRYLFREKTRAALLGERGLVGVVPAKVIRSYLQESASKGEIGSPGTTDRRRRLKERTIPFNFGIYGKGMVGANPTRFMRVAAAAGNLGGNRVIPVVPQVCKKCGWADFYVYIRPITKCKNPDPTVEPQPWPHTLG